jgi:hypothetical protein
MEPDPDYESWLLEAADPVILRKASTSLADLSDWERAVYCLWVADYGIRNAGDLQSAHQLEPTFKNVGRRAARALRLGATSALFERADAEFVLTYLASFETVCRELASARPPV